ncbi:MAG TPA: hypothetical protein VJ921_05210 [Vicinamibacteria bacterium]|nr:hypothetical protein [Vicinamibacteria bacterium]
MSDRDEIFHEAPSFARELDSVPPGRRRLGFLVIAIAVLVGASVLFLLFLSSIYFSDPPAMHRTLLDTLSREIASKLDPAAADREEEIADAFRALASANDSGNLGLRELFAVTRSYVETSADGVIDPEEVDILIESIRSAVMEATAPRRL